MKFRETIDLNDDAIQILKINQLLQQYSKLNRGHRRFLNKAIRINQSGEPFTYRNFEDIKKSTFKNYVYHLRHAGFVEVVAKTNFTWYKIKGFMLKGHWQKLTPNPTGVSTSNKDTHYNAESIYGFLKDHLRDLDDPSLHNIRLHFYVENIHEKLVLEYTKDIPFQLQYIPANKSFIIRPRLYWGKDFDAQIIITPKNLVQVIINNTFRPLACNEKGIFELNAKLGEIKEYLRMYSNNIPLVSNWLFVRADFGRDCKCPLNRIFPATEFHDLAGALVRFYAKSWPDKTSRLRIETIITPNKPMNDMPEFLNIVKIPEIPLPSDKKTNGLCLKDILKL